MTALPRRDFDFSASWQRQMHPRRGSRGVTGFTPAPKARAAVAAQVEAARERILPMLEMSQAQFREPVRAWTEQDAGAPPLGAAVVALTVLTQWDLDLRKAPFADAWIAERGLTFAAEAAAELMTLALAGDAHSIRRLFPGEQPGNWRQLPQLQVVLRVRAALAAAPDDEYAAVVGVLAGYRSREGFDRVVTSVLAPTESAWVTQDVADVVAAKDDYRGFSLTQALSSVEQLEQLDAASNATWRFRRTLLSSAAFVATVVDALGSDALGPLMRWLDEEELDADTRRRVLSAVAQMPAEAALRALADRVEEKFVSPALLEAAGRFPGPGLKVLAATGVRGELAELLRAQVQAHPEAAAHLLSDPSQLSPEAVDRVRALLGGPGAPVPAPGSALPSLLVSPPWLTPVVTAKPVVVPGLVCEDEPEVHWEEGEREAFATPEIGRRYEYDARAGDTWEQRAEKVAGNDAYWWEPTAFFLQAPESLARSVLPGWTPHDFAGQAEVSPVAAQFGVEALPAVLRKARRAPAVVGPLLLPFSSPEIAVQMADWLSRRKSARGTASAWLLRHPAAAARALVPPALGRSGAARRRAEEALVYLGTHGRADVVRTVAQGHGLEVAAAIEALLARDPLALLPARMPVVPTWVQPGFLPAVRLRDGSGVLPAPAVGHLATVFALSRMDEPYPGLDVVKEVLLPEDLSAFAWGLFQRWHAAGAAAKENWVLDALGLVGDDDVVRELTPLILAWPGEGGHARAVTGVNVLAAIGTDVALMHLHRIAQRARFKGLKTAAQQMMADVADDLGLTAEQLADRLVPGLGLEADGSMRLDYGPRQFVVEFDEQLRPYVADATGKHLKSLPKPGAKDDPVLAPAAYQQFSALKKDVRKIGADALVRLELAMVSGRRWSGAEFGQLFVGHPLMWHIVRRLVWGLYDAEGRLTGAVRVAEDRTLADVDDEAVSVDDDAVVGVVHPLHLGAAVAPWAGVFADYEILQPFAQLARPVYELTEQEVREGRLERFEGLKLPTTKLLGLERRGWSRDDPMDAGIQGSIGIRFDAGIECGIGLDPGIVVGEPNYWQEQTLSDVTLGNLASGAGEQPQGAKLGLRPADRVAVSEILRDLTDITVPAS